MRNRRGILMAMALVAILGVVGAAASFYVLQVRLPDPEHANRQQLVRWLVRSDLDQQSAELRARLAGCLDAEFQAAFDWQQVQTRLDAQQRKLLCHNLVLLFEPWFLEKMEGYFALPPSQRTGYLDRLLDRVTAWRGVVLLWPDDAESPGTQKHSGVLGMLMEQVAACQAKAQPDQRDKIAWFLAAIEARWLLRELSRAL